MKPKSTSVKALLLVGICLSLVFNARSAYVLNGSASATGNNCFIITPAANNERGSVWNDQYISLEFDFNMTFQVYLGSNDLDGGDGIAFVLQSVGTNALGGVGSGIGYSGISPSLAVEYDTYQNNGEPAFDHIAVQLNGVLDNSGVQAATYNANIEDGQWHSTLIVWMAASHTLVVYFDGIARLGYGSNIVNNIFGGNPLVYWGFTGATGGFNNLQQFCVTSVSLQGPNVIPLSPWVIVLVTVLILSVSGIRYRRS